MLFLECIAMDLTTAGGRGQEGECRCPRTCAEQHSLTPSQRRSPFSWTKMKVFLPLPELPLQKALVGLSPPCIILLIFFLLFCFSWILLSSFPPYCTLATLPSWSCPSGSWRAPSASTQPTCSCGRSTPPWKSTEAAIPPAGIRHLRTRVLLGGTGTSPSSF